MTQDAGNQAFHLHAMLLWTIHDFPGYGTVGGFSHQGYAACPWCGMELGAEHSVELGKCTYGGTRRWLPDDHPFKSQEMQDHFNGARETRAKPRAVTVEEQLAHAVAYETGKQMAIEKALLEIPQKFMGSSVLAFFSGCHIGRLVFCFFRNLSVNCDCCMTFKTIGS